MSGEPFDIGRYVSSQIYRLIGKNPGQLSPTARGLMAQLRQAVAAEPGTVPAIWSLTAEGLPDEPNDARQLRLETAVHLALTQFAVHQQARSSAMHTSRQRFGTAVRRLADRQSGADQDPHETPIYARFSAMLTTSTLRGLQAHTKGIIPQLRDEEIAFDYGAYARDIYWFLTPGQSNEVRRRWGRDFHRVTSLTAETTDTTEGDNK